MSGRFPRMLHRAYILHTPTQKNDYFGTPEYPEYPEYPEPAATGAGWAWGMTRVVLPRSYPKYSQVVALMGGCFMRYRWKCGIQLTAICRHDFTGARTS